jgi:hypothetical protein
MDLSVSAYCLGVRVVPLVKIANGLPCRVTQRVISIAPGSGTSPSLCRSPSTSVPSMSKTKPRTVRSRSRTAAGTPAPPGSATASVDTVAAAQFHAEARLLDDEA